MTAAPAMLKVDELARHYRLPRSSLLGPRERIDCTALVCVQP